MPASTCTPRSTCSIWNPSATWSAQITGVRQLETLPDRVFDEADEVKLVDMPPDDLLQRLREGRVYVAQQAERALQNFFRKGNLIALRELALRKTADRVDQAMRDYRKEKAVRGAWAARERAAGGGRPGRAGRAAGARRQAHSPTGSMPNGWWYSSRRRT